MADEKKVESASKVADENKSLVEDTNASVEKATAQATGDNSRVVQVDAILGADEKHGDLVRTAQAASFGEEYDPKNDPESASFEPKAEAPVASLNQNNLKHPTSDEYNDPFMSKNYLGQPL